MSHNTHLSLYIFIYIYIYIEREREREREREICVKSEGTLGASVWHVLPGLCVGDSGGAGSSEKRCCYDYRCFVANGSGEAGH